jgi:hypothetical protein
MAKREKNPQEHSQGLLVETAKAIGGLAGKLAHAVGAGESHPATGDDSAGSQEKRGKLQPKNKSRLPRRQKKAQKKAAKLQAA